MSEGGPPQFEDNDVSFIPIFY